MINKLNFLYIPFLSRGFIYSISDFIFYICFTIWSITIVPPYNYLVYKFKSVLIKYHQEGGIEKVKMFLYSVATITMLFMGIIMRKIYDCFYDDWYTYTILMVSVYFIGSYLSKPLLHKLWEFWKDVYAERITDMARWRYDNSNIQHTVVYDVDTMLGGRTI